MKFIVKKHVKNNFSKNGFSPGNLQKCIVEFSILFLFDIFLYQNLWFYYNF